MRVGKGRRLRSYGEALTVPEFFALVWRSSDGRRRTPGGRGRSPAASRSSRSLLSAAISFRVSHRRNGIQGVGHCVPRVG